MRRFNHLALFALLALATGAPLAQAAEPAKEEVPEPSRLPVPKGAYRLDKSHATLLFRVDHLGFSFYTGRFARFDAELDFDPRKLATSRVSATVDVASLEVDGPPEGFLTSLMGDKWFDSARFPQMSFRSLRVVPKDAQSFRIEGDLTLLGVSKPVTLDARYNGGYAGHPYDPQARIGFSARGVFKRSDFGMSYGVPDPGSKFGVGEQVEVILEAEFHGPKLAE
jgi:polyisoprenoid-binding protein YceI